MTSPSKPWGGVTDVAGLDPANPLARPGTRLLVTGVNPSYLLHTLREHHVEHWADLLFHPERLSESAEKYFPGSLVMAEAPQTFGPFGVVIVTAGEHVLQGSNVQGYEPRLMGETRAKPNPDPEAVLSRRNEVMIRRGEHVGIAACFVKTINGEPLDPIGAEIAQANAERLKVPLLRIPEVPPHDDWVRLGPEPGRIDVRYEGCEYCLRRPEAPRLVSWEGMFRPSKGYNIPSFPAPATARRIAQLVASETRDDSLVAQLMAEYHSADLARRSPRISDTDTDIRLARGYGLAATEVVISRYENPRQRRVRDEAVAGAWDEVHRVYSGQESYYLVRRQNELKHRGTEIPNEEVDQALAEARAAAEAPRSGVDPAISGRAQRVYREIQAARAAFLDFGRVLAPPPQPAVSPTQSPSPSLSRTVPPPARSPVTSGPGGWVRARLRSLRTPGSRSRGPL